MPGLIHDLRAAMRSLFRKPFFALTAVLMLGVGLGASSGVFTLVDALLLRPLDIKEPERLVRLTNSRPDVSHPIPFSYPMWQRLRGGQQSLEGLFAWAYPALTLEIDGTAERAGAMVASGDVFSVLGVGASLGRTLTAADDGERVVVLSHEFWRRRFGADPDVIGRTIRLEQQPYTVVGVAARGFAGLQPGVPCELITPLDTFAAASLNVDRRARRLLWLEIHGRLKDGVSQSEAEAELRVRWPAIVDETIPLDAAGEREARFRSQAIGLEPAARGSSRYQEVFANPLYLLGAITGLLLLIVCVNIANLMLAQATAKRRETAIRRALGAGKTRILRQTAAECLLLTLTGAGLGLAFSVLVSRAIAAFWDSGAGRLALDLRLDVRQFAFLVVTAAAAAALAGLAPALRAVSADPNEAMQSGAGRVAGSRSRAGFMLLAAQVAFSLCLLSGAGLLSRTLANLRDQPMDFARDNVVAFTLGPAGNSYQDRDISAYYQELLAQTAAIPGVDAVALTDSAPLETWPSPFRVEAASPLAAQGVTATSGCASPELFQALQTPVLAGRTFTPADRKGAELVAIVNSRLAMDLFGRPNPLGEQIGFGLEPGIHERRIVGVVQDRGYRGFRQADVPAVYVPCAQPGRVWAEGYLTLVARARGDVAGIIRPVQEKVDALGVETAVRTARLSERAEESLLRERALASIASAVAGIALLLAGIGLYSLAAYTLRSQRRAIGVRMAVGADRRRVIAWVLKGALTVAVTGLAAGLPAAVFAGRYAEAALFGVSAADPLTLAAAGMILAAVCVLAALVPALQAASIEPMSVLREE